MLFTNIQIMSTGYNTARANVLTNLKGRYMQTMAPYDSNFLPLKIVANGINYEADLLVIDPSTIGGGRQLLAPFYKIITNYQNVNPSLTSNFATLGWAFNPVNTLQDSLINGLQYQNAIYDPLNPNSGWITDIPTVQTFLQQHLTDIVYCMGDYWSKTTGSYPRRGVNRMHMCELGNGVSAPYNGYYQSGALFFDTGAGIDALFVRFRDQY